MISVSSQITIWFIGFEKYGSINHKGFFVNAKLHTNIWTVEKSVIATYNRLSWNAL